MPTTARTDSAFLPVISYVGGQLTIHVRDSTLSDVLAKVTALTGVKIDVPDAAASERMPMVQLGPGPARQVLTALLSDSNFDYVIQASDIDPEKLQSVLVMPRDKKEAGPAMMDAPERPARNAYPRGASQIASAGDASVPDAPVPAPPSNSSLDDSASNAPPAQGQADQSAAIRALQGQSAALKQETLSPPATLNTQTISEQLQQMYQQRMQMIQQGRQTSPP